MPRCHFKLLPEFPKSAGSIKEFDDWDKKMQAEYPCRYKLNKCCDHLYRKLVLFPMWRIRDAKWWVLNRFHPKHIHHKLTISSLEPGYYDARSIILHAPFDVFCKFMDKIYNGDSYVLWEVTKEEDDWEHLDAEEIDRINTRWYEMQALYTWWMIKRPNREDLWEEANPRPDLPPEWGIMCMFNDDYRDTDEVKEWSAHAMVYNTQRELWIQEDEDMFVRLVKLRPCLWD